MENTYTENQVNEKIEEAKKQMYNDQILRFAKQMESISNNLVVKQKKNIFNKTFNQDTVNTYIQNPQKYEKELRQLSTILYTLSPMYSQIVNYYPSISRFIPIVTPNLDKFTNGKGELHDEDKLKKEYIKTVNYVGQMNIEHEFKKVLEVSARDDLFYGYIYTDKSGKFYIQQLDSDYCRISSVTSGVFNFAFNFKYFDNNKNLKGLSDDGKTDDLINYYPEEFKSKYSIYNGDKSNKQWQELDEKNTICFKFNEGLPFPFPPYANLWNDLAYLNDMKDLVKATKESETYKFIGQQIPINKGDKPDDFAITTETALSFYQMILSSLPEGVGTFLTPCDIKEVSFSGNNVGDKDQINNAESSLFVSSGISPVIFGKNATSSTGLKSSNLQDSSRLYKLYDQFQRWLNRYLGFIFNDKFTVELLKVTTFTIEDEIKRQKEAMSLGVPNKIMVAGLLGINQSNERALSTMERLLDLQNEWLPPNNAYTTSGNEDSVGRPESEDIDSSGDITRENENNIDKG